MYAGETGGEISTASGVAPGVTASSIKAAIGHLQTAFARVPSIDSADGADLIDEITLLERLKCVASAVQAHRTAVYAASREAELARFKSRDKQDTARRDIGTQIGLARRVSPRLGATLVGVAKVLTTEMPHTRSALQTGRIDEYQATLIVAETATLSLTHRQVVDVEIADRLGTLTSRQVKGAAASIGSRLDPEQAVKRLRKAEKDRCVTLRMAPDTMAYVTALLPSRTPSPPTPPSPGTPPPRKPPATPAAKGR